RLRRGLPTCPWALIFLKAKGNAKRIKQWLVEGHGSRKVAYANHDVRKHLASPSVCLTENRPTACYARCWPNKPTHPKEGSCKCLICMVFVSLMFAHRSVLDSLT